MVRSGVAQGGSHLLLHLTSFFGDPMSLVTVGRPTGKRDLEGSSATASRLVGKLRIDGSAGRECNQLAAIYCAIRILATAHL